MYVAVKGGERAIENAHRLLANARRGDQSVAEVSLDQISEQLGLAVNAALFPRGVDIVLVDDDAIVAIPRTTRLIGKEG